MANLTTVTLTSGVATAGTGTVSTIDNMLGIASTPSSNVLTVQGSTGMTPFLITVGTTTTAAAVKGASTAPLATDPALVVAISPNSVNPNGRATAAASAPVVLNKQNYQSISSSTSAVALSGGGGGALGDYLDTILIIPSATSASAVSITDGSTGASISIFAGGGGTALTMLIPFPVPIGATSITSAWHVSALGAGVSVLAVGTFT